LAGPAVLVVAGVCGDAALPAPVGAPVLVFPELAVPAPDPAAPEPEAAGPDDPFPDAPPPAPPPAPPAPPPPPPPWARQATGANIAPTRAAAITVDLTDIGFSFIGQA
jgi:hypothetical protein